MHRYLIILLLGVLPISAQRPSQQTVKGNVLDSRMAPITGAEVHAGDAAVVSDERGAFSLSTGATATELQVSAPGFKPWKAPLQSLPEPLEVVLEVASHHETVTVMEQPDYAIAAVSSATKTLTPLIDVPQSVSIVNRELMRDQLMMSIADVVRYIPGVTAIQGENNRDQLVIRGNSTSADFFVDGVRDDVQYFRDLYNVERVEAVKGANALTFGRGGGGGVINRVSKEAGFDPQREIQLQGGSFGNKRASIDLNQPLGSRVAVRLNSVYENSDTFRDYGHLQRWGIAPSLTIQAGPNTKIRLGYEDFHDARVADRGIPSWNGRPLMIDPATFFGNPDQSRVRAGVHTGYADVEHQAGRFHVRNHFSAGDIGRAYQNFVPGAVNASQTAAALTAYNNATRRLNLFNQTDVSSSVNTGGIRHTLLAGVEIGRQGTGNFRNTGYFGTATSTTVPLSDPVLRQTADFRQSATDADNHVLTVVGASYLQDQVELSRVFQVVAGVRFDHFDLRFHNNRTGEELRRIDNMVSPRLGLVIKPADHVSVYFSHSISWLPSSGDQFSSLTTITQQVKPERFANNEVGVKWDVRRTLALTAAVYRLDRTNTRSTDPNDPTRIVQTGSQRSNGLELGANGRITSKWRIAAGYNWQDVHIQTDTTAARAGARVAQTPAHAASLWNNYQFHRRWGAGLGILGRTAMFAAVDNTVVLPGYVREDAALYYSVREGMRLQLNLENLSGRRYYLNADSNNNISPGSPRAVRLAWTTRF